MSLIGAGGACRGARSRRNLSWSSRLSDAARRGSQGLRLEPWGLLPSFARLQHRSRRADPNSYRVIAWSSRWWTTSVIALTRARWSDRRSSANHFPTLFAAPRLAPVQSITYTIRRTSSRLPPGPPAIRAAPAVARRPPRHWAVGGGAHVARDRRDERPTDPAVPCGILPCRVRPPELRVTGGSPA